MKMVSITLDKERVLKFGVKAFVEVEKVLDISMDEIDFERQETIYALLYAGLIHEDRKLTLDKVYDIVDGVIEKRAEEQGVGFMEVFGETLMYIGNKVGEALGNKVDDEKPND